MSEFLKHTVCSGDTLPHISQRYLGSASRYVEIAYINNLVYPFIISGVSTQEGVKGIGDTIFIPNELDDTTIIEEEQVTNQNLYGSDLALTNVFRDDTISVSQGGELVTDYLTEDLLTVDRLDCLIQDLRHRLMTEMGTLLHHPLYGSKLNTIIGNKNDDAWRHKAMLEVHRCISCDDRVHSIDNIQVFPRGSEVHISCDVTTIYKDVIKMNAQL